MSVRGFRYHLFSSIWPVLFNTGVLLLFVSIISIFQIRPQSNLFISLPIFCSILIMYIGAFGMVAEVLVEQTTSQEQEIIVSEQYDEYDSHHEEPEFKF